MSFDFDADFIDLFVFQENSLKIVMVGDSGVGKSCLLGTAANLDSEVYLFYKNQYSKLLYVWNNKVDVSALSIFMHYAMHAFEISLIKLHSAIPY